VRFVRLMKPDVVAGVYNIQYEVKDDDVTGARM
jgi:hypothetical protein